MLRVEDVHILDKGLSLFNGCEISAEWPRIKKELLELAQLSHNSLSPICPCQIHDVGIMPSVGQVHATIIFDIKCPAHGRIGR